LPDAHPVEPAAQTPAQAPATHVELVQALPLFCHIPAELQSCGCCPLHWSCPGAHEPAHAPETHVEFVHVTELPQVPVEVHVCTPLPDAEH
jgi:hypothetical protein